MLALPHSLDELDFLTNPEEDFWTPISHTMGSDEGWTVVIQDFDDLRTTSGGFWFFVAVEKETRRPVSCFLVALDEASINGAEPLYTGGFWYTDSEWRGTGVGMQLFGMMMAVCGSHNIAMNSDLSLSSHYAISPGANKIRDYYIKWVAVQLDDIAPSQEIKGLVAKELHEVEWRDVVDYDVKVRTRKREKYLRKLLECSDHVFARIILNDKGKVVGFGSLRVETRGFLCMGPLYADNKDVARLIFDSVLPLIDKEKFRSIEAWVPSCNLEAERLITEVSGGKCEIAPFLQPQFTKHIIPVDDKKVFCVTDVGVSYV